MHENHLYRWPRIFCAKYIAIVTLLVLMCGGNGAQQEKLLFPSVRAQSEAQSEPIQVAAETVGTPYNYTVIAKAGQAGITAFGAAANQEYVSINDAGMVAFIGRSSNGGQGIYVGNGEGSPKRISFPNDEPNAIRTFEPGIILSNQNFVSAIDNDQVSIGSGTTFRQWNAITPALAPALHVADLVFNSRCPDAITCPYSRLYGFVSANNSGLATFMGQNRINQNPVDLYIYETGEKLAYFDKTPPVEQLATPRPVMGDDGFFVFRDDRFSCLTPRVNCPNIRRFKADNLDVSEIVASGDHFSILGQSPGVSDDGRVIVFYGKLTQDGANALNTAQANRHYADNGELKVEKLNPGEGIFASVDTDVGRVVLRIAGLSGSSYLDPGEQWQDANGNRQFDSGDTDFGLFSGFYPDSPVSVNSMIEEIGAIKITYLAQREGRKGLQANEVVFVVSPSRKNANRALQPNIITVYTPLSPIEEGQTIPNLAGTIQDLRLYDSINLAGQIALWVRTTSTQAVVRIEPLVLPLIFIPGVAGSELTRISIGSPYYKIWLIDVNRRDISLEVNSDSRVYAPDVLRKYPMLDWLKFTYGSFLEFLTGEGNYREYDVDDDPSRRTVAGCDLTQTANKPTLFVFAYDWRLSLASNAAKLAEYVLCVQTFYPGTQVNMVAHSMGGLVARRYIIDQFDTSQKNYGHEVNQLITIGSPLLGAPKLIYVLETGDFVPWMVTGEDVKFAVQSMPGAHQLMPSNLYYNVAKLRPFIESGWDFNKNKNAFEYYSYEDTKEALNVRHPIAGANIEKDPATIGEDFHSYERNGQKQDDWSNDNTGIRYTHIVGLQSIPDTPGQVVATTFERCKVAVESLKTCTNSESFLVVPTIGDGTVPLVSARRIGNGYNYNVPSAEIVTYSNPENNTLVSHTGLTSYDQVQKKILELLNPQIAVDTQGEVASVAQTQVSEDEITSSPFYGLLVMGGSDVVVQDGHGNSTAPIYEDILGIVPGVSTFTSGEMSKQLILSTTETYSVEFHTTDQSLLVELTRGTEMTVTRAIRYIDVLLPANVNVQLVLTPHGPQQLRYDSNSDGSYENTVTPTVDVTGIAAQDIDAPIIAIDASQQGQFSFVTVMAQDSGAGVKQIYYSLDGFEFQVYTQTVQVDRSHYSLFYAFADDNLANRSSLISYNLPEIETATKLLVNSNLLEFKMGQGGANPPTQSFAIASNGEILDWNAATSASWIGISSVLGETPATINVSVNPVELTPGVHNGTVTVEAEGAENSPQTITVTLTIEPKNVDTPALQVGPSALSYSMIQGSGNPPAQSITISSDGEDLAWNASANASWITLSVQSGETPASINVGVDPTNLTVGIHTATVVIQADGAENSPQAVVITLIIDPVTPVDGPALQVGPTALAYNIIQGSGNPPAQALTIGSAGEKLNWMASANAPWMKLSATNGETPASVEVGVNASGLAAGVHSGQITFYSSGSSSGAIVVDVNLLIQVQDESSEAILQVESAPLNFVANVEGANPAGQSFTISNHGRGSLQWIASTSSSWLRLSSTTGSAPATVNLSFDTTGLLEGTYTAQITLLSATQGSPKFLNVTLNLYAPILIATPADLIFTVQAGQSSPTAKQLKIENGGTGTLDWLVSESLPWLTLSANSGTAPSTIDVSVNLAGVAPGTYTGDITVVSAENAALMQTTSVQLTVDAQQESYQLFMPRMMRP